MTFIDFWHKLVFHPKKFFSEDFDGKSSPFLVITIAIYGMSSAMDRLDQQFIKADYRGDLIQYDWLNNWPTYWLVVAVTGAIGGYIFYLIGGWFYNLRIQWSHGTSDREKAKFLFLYPEFVPALIYVLDTFLYMLESSVPYDAYAELTTGQAIGLILMLGATYYSVYISYIGVTTTTDVSVQKARIWFLILPLAFYTIALGAVFGIVLAYFS